MINDINYAVFVRCITFNQASYIEDAMNGFCIQKTNFPFVCAIFDDDSTDGEIEVIRNYLHKYFDYTDNGVARTEETDDYVLQFVRHKNNLNCYFVVVFLKYNHWRLKKNKDNYVSEWYVSSKYKAECEGDDYWIDPLKLQKQVDFLESHPDYSMCFHGAIIKCESNSYPEARKHQFDGLETREYKGEELIKKWIIPTASMVSRASIVPPKDPRFLATDLVYRNQCTIEGRVYCFADKMSVYRLNDGGVSKNGPWKDIERQLNHFEALIEHFPQYKSFYLQLLKKVLRHSLLSRNARKTMRLFLKKPKVIRYLF